MYAVQNVGRCVMSCSADNSLCIGFLDGQTAKGHAGPAAPSGRAADRKRADCAASHVAAAREKDSGVGSHNMPAAVAPTKHNSGSGATAAVALVGAAPAASAQVAQHALRSAPVNNDALQTAAANEQKVAALRERPASTLLERPLSLPPSPLQEASIPPVRLPQEAAENHLNELREGHDAHAHARAPNADVHAARARSPKGDCSFASKCKSFFSKRFAKRFGSPISN